MYLIRTMMGRILTVKVYIRVGDEGWMKGLVVVAWATCSRGRVGESTGHGMMLLPLLLTQCFSFSSFDDSSFFFFFLLIFGVFF